MIKFLYRLFFRKKYEESIIKESEKNAKIYMEKVEQIIDSGDIIYDEKLNKWVPREEYINKNCF
jgi:hypothetical protein